MGGGSSPLTRGKRSAESYSSPQAWAHPRSRGENGTMHALGAGGAGSSPLTRGKQAQDPQPDGEDRLIPAHAGKTSSQSARHAP